MNELHEKTVIVTTSWDDGHPHDLRLSNLLNTFGVKGTYYIPQSNEGMPVVTKEGIRALKSCGGEIGAHTLTHVELPAFGKKRIGEELSGGKKYLEDIIGEEVTSFCYPRGKFKRDLRYLVADAGYKLARTTFSFNIDNNYDPLYMPTSLQFYPHSPYVHTQHAIKELNIKGLYNYLALFHIERDLYKLVTRIFDHVVDHGGVFHLWGHSWEIEKMQLWSLLEKTLRYISSRNNVQYMSNKEVVDFRTSISSTRT